MLTVYNVESKFTKIMNKLNDLDKMLQKCNYTNSILIQNIERNEKNYISIKENRIIYLIEKYDVVLIRESYSNLVKLGKLDDRLKFKHKNIAKTYMQITEKYLDKYLMWIVMDYLEEKVLCDYTLGEIQIKNICRDMISGITYFRNISNLNLKFNAFSIVGTRKKSKSK